MFHNVRGPDGKFVSKKQNVTAKANAYNNTVATKGMPLRDANGRFLPKTANKVGAKAKAKPVAAKPKVAPVTNKVTSSNPTVDIAKQETHVMFLLDDSGSMAGIRLKAYQAFNNLLGQVKVEAHTQKQKTLMNVELFPASGYNRQNQWYAPNILFKNAFPETVHLREDQYLCRGGSTPLFRTIENTCKEISKRIALDPNSNDAYLVIVVTDGGDTHGVDDKNSFRSLVNNLMNSNKVTFAISTPREGVQQLYAMGFNLDSIQVWDGDERTLGVSTQQTAKGITRYMSARSVGQTSVPKFYTNLNGADLSVLQDVSSLFKSATVDKEIDITAFFMEKRGVYIPGQAYYELTKPEMLQDHKKILIQDKNTNKVLSGDKVRSVLGLPDTGNAKVVPGNHDKYRLFVQSTSANRKLVRGTKVLYTA